MDIKNIKGPGSFPGAPSDSAPESNVSSKPGNQFSEVVADTGSSAVEGAQAVGQVHRAELDDPAKLESLVRACVSELITNGEGQLGQISPADKQSLTDFLSSDPLFRQQIESYLRKVAS
jgi:hypothetical protein